MEQVKDKDGVSYNVVSHDEKHPDKTVANKWKWEWLNEHDHGSEKRLMSDYLCKLDVDGLAFCRWCKVMIKYGSTGKKACQKHACNHSDHEKYLKMMKNQSQLPSTHNTAVSTSMTNASKEKIVHILDRTSHLEAYILQFICENNLPLSMAPKLVHFGTTISDDPRAFKRLAKDETDEKDIFSRPTATYKIVHGLSHVFHSRIALALQTTSFSINIDECTSKTGIKVFSIIVMYFDRTIGKSVIQNYKSLSVIKADAKTITSKITNQLKEDEIPLTNLIADLSDSASTMRGRHSGVEKRLRDVAPHMLYIGGDTCHDMHRACKAFADNFGKHVEKFVGDVHNDVKWSVDILEGLKDICLISGEVFHKPPERTDHRWLSTYDCVVKLQPMMTSLRILYYSFLPSKSDGEIVGKDMYENEYKALLDEKNIDDCGKKAINEINKSMGKKTMTEDGVKRKQRIYGKLWETSDRTLLIMQQYDVIYPMFKSFVLVFEQKTPQIHKLYPKLVEVLRQFFSAFMKHELIKKASGSQLKKMEISERTVREKEDMFYGAQNERLIKKMKELKRGDIVEEFQTNVKDSYIKCGNYLQSKVPIDLPVLKCLGSLNPMAIGYSTNHKYLKKLGDFFPQILDTSEKLNGFLKDISAIQLDNCLPSAILDEKEVLLDDWWHKVMSSKKYPFLSLVVEACLSIFSGPIVEGTFSILNNVMDKKHNRLECETYDAILKCKMFQQSTGKSSSDMYRRKDSLLSPVDNIVCKSMRLAASRYKKHKATKQNILKKKLQDIGGKSTLPRSKKGEKRLKSVHELNSALKDVMRSTAAGGATKDVSRSAVMKRKGEDGAMRKGDGDGAVQRNNEGRGDEEDGEEDVVVKTSQERKEGNLEESTNEEEDLVVKDYVPPKKTKQASMYSFFNKK